MFSACYVVKSSLCDGVIFNLLWSSKSLTTSASAHDVIGDRTIASSAGVLTTAGPGLPPPVWVVQAFGQLLDSARLS